MPDAAAGSFFKRKIGPLSPLGWLGVGAATGAVYYIYEKYEAKAAATAATAGAATSAAPIDTGSTSGSSGSSSTTATPAPTDVGSWLEAIVTGLSGQGINGADAYNAGLAWINGNCVSAQMYSALGGILSTVGPPPGYGAYSPPLSVCQGTAPKVPSTPTAPTGAVLLDQQVTEAEAIMAKLHGGQPTSSAAYKSEYAAILATLQAQGWYVGQKYPTGITQQLGAPAPPVKKQTTSGKPGTGVQGSGQKNFGL